MRIVSPGIVKSGELPTFSTFENSCLISVTPRITLLAVIKSFADKHTSMLYSGGKSRRLPPDLLKRAIRRLEYIDLAASLDDLKVPPSNRLHALKDDRTGQHSISINDQWRICFRLADGDAFDVEISDYH